MDCISKLFQDTRGASTVEYAAIASLISIAAVGAMGGLATGVAALFGTVPSF